MKLFFFLLLLTLSIHFPALEAEEQPPPSCQNKCGSLPIKYPFGTGYGCGSPRFSSFISCSSSSTTQDQQQQEQLFFTSHTGTYPITSISYSTSTFTITPPLMSTCSFMQSSSNFGLDWSSPFQLGPSLFILLACPPPTSSLTFKNSGGGSSSNPICDPSFSHLCASIHTCSSLVTFGLPIFAPINTCCVYSPANLNYKGDLDLKALKCAGFASVVSLGDIPPDPNRWEYGVILKYNLVGLDNYDVATVCDACQKSDGVCGYAPPKNNFVCVCKNGANSSRDCLDLGNPMGVGVGVGPVWSSVSTSGSEPESPDPYASYCLINSLYVYCTYIICFLIYHWQEY